MYFSKPLKRSSHMCTGRLSVNAILKDRGTHGEQHGVVSHEERCATHAFRLEGGKYRVFRNMFCTAAHFHLEHLTLLNRE